MGELSEIPDIPAEVVSRFPLPSAGAATFDGAGDSERDDSSSCWSEKEDEEEEEEEKEDDLNTLQPKTESLGLSEDYVPDWKPQDAFRELYQNL
jgi:hypothetical protein